MRILMISDTHGNHQMIESMLERAKDYDLTVHLGDNYEDANLFFDAGLPLVRIPGTWGVQYSDPMIDNRRMEEWMGWRFFLTHTPEIDSHDLPEDLDPYAVITQQACDVMCHGHTHEPNIRFSNNVLIMNPGHLKADVDRGFSASYAEVILNRNDCFIEIIDVYSGKTIKSHHLFR